jgi:Family of unknown function (DUF5994)
MTPHSSDRTTAVAPTRQPTPQGPRLRLDPTLARKGSLDGGWWPRSPDPETELPDLIRGLESSLGVITRVALNPDAWDSAPRQVAIDGRRVHVGWFRAMNADTIGVTRGSRDRFVLLVVPPQATPPAAATAMAMAADATSSARPADLLVASGIGAQDTVATSLDRRISSGLQGLNQARKRHAGQPRRETVPRTG